MSTGLESVRAGGLGVVTARATVIDRLARRMVLSRLRQLSCGQITISENGEHIRFGRSSGNLSLTAHLCVHSPKFYRLVALRGAIGAAEAYIDGHWECAELGDLLRILIRNRDILERLNSGLALISRPFQKLVHTFNRNTRRGSRRNIAAHYDLGNDFYRLWLDPKMMYSSAYFDTQETQLAEASTDKLDRICRKLDLSASDTVVEIGTGWGGFAIHAATYYGCHVTTTTISQQQYDYARRAIIDAGVEDRVTLLLQDYRTLGGHFDKLVSIEMIEAVGHQYHDTYFRKCCALLKPDGQMLLQAITMADQRYEQYKNGVDFIKRYIFPGGCLVSVTSLAQTMTKSTDLRLIHLEDIGPHYATTLRHWRDRFMAQLDEVRGLGYSEAFIRMWQFYLAYSESAFIERAIGNIQVLAVRPDARREKINY